MTEHPTPEQLAALLGPPGSAEPWVEDHVNAGCAPCNSYLNNRVGPPGEKLKLYHSAADFLSLSDPVNFPGAPTAKGPLGTVGPYHVKAFLGQGGVGQVYLAVHEQLAQPVVLKVLHPRLAGSRQAVLRFLREARNADRITDTSHVVEVINVFDSGKLTKDFPFPVIVMEYVEGQTIKDLIASRNPGETGRQASGPSHPVTPHHAAEIVEQAALGLKAVHGVGIVHGDVKPNNVKVRGFSMQPVVKLLDFGLARLLGQIEDDITADGLVCGAGPYLTPEHLKPPHKPLNQSDLYALGLILYELLTGGRAFAADPLSLDLRKVVPSPRQRNPDVPRDLDTICTKMLERDLDRRYGSAKEVAEELRRFLDGEPIQARAVGAPERLVKWARRKPAVAALTAAVVALFLAFTVYSQYARWKTDQALDSTRRAADLAALAAIAAVQGDREGAGEAFQQLVAIREGLVAERPGDAQARNDLVKARMQLGIWHMLAGEWDEADATFGKCESDLDVLRRQEPASETHRFLLAECLDNHGMALLGLEQYDSAADCHRKALPHREFLAAVPGPRRSLYRAYLASTHNHLGNALHGAGALDEAEGHYQESIRILRELVAAEREQPSHRQELAYPLLGLGQLRLTQGKPGEARPLVQEAIDLQKALHEGESDNPGYAFELGVGHLSMGDVARRSNPPDEALAEYRAASELVAPGLLRAPNRVEAQRALAEARAGEAWALFKLKRDDEAIKAAHAAAVASESPLVGSAGRVRVSVVLALASGATKADARRSADYARRALTLLEQARAKGYFRIAANANEVKTDEDLASLGDAVVRRLVKEAAPVKNEQP